MKLTESQWAELSILIPEPKVRADGRGRPWVPNRNVLEGILWVLKTGARWRDLPRDKYPPYQTCHRRFQQWVKAGVFFQIIRALTLHLKQVGKIDLTETYIDASFVEAKKGGTRLVPLRVEKAQKSWPSQTLTLFLCPFILRVLHAMRVDVLKRRFGEDIVASVLSELWVTKLTIQIHSMNLYRDDIESGLLLPISTIESREQLKMAELYADTKEDGEWNDSLPGFKLLEELKRGMKERR